MRPSDVVERSRRDVVRLSLANERIVLQEVFEFRLVGFGLPMEDLFGFGSVGIRQ